MNSKLEPEKSMIKARAVRAGNVMEASRGNKLEKTNVLTSITLTNKQRNREENFRILQLVAEKKT